MRDKLLKLLPGLLVSVLATIGSASASPDMQRRLITRSIDDSQTVMLRGNVHPEANAANDRGAVADEKIIDHMQLLLSRPAETEAALASLIEQQNDPTSSSYHHWLTAAQFGASFGPAKDDVQDVEYWLRSHGFVVNGVQTSRMVIDFSGTAGQVSQAFGTAMHRFEARGGMHIANVSNPRIPAALSGIVHGIVSLNDFRPHTSFKPRPAYTFTSGGSAYQAIVPADLATIYNLNPLFASGLSGQGQTIVVIEDSDVYSAANWTAFRNAFGLSTYGAGSFTQVHPAGGSGNCADPGAVPGSEAEATLDAQWASAAAPSAAIKLASCRDTSTVFGGLIALQNLLNGTSPPSIVSISYGECEAENGAAVNAAYTNTYQQAAAMGVSVFVAAGDEGAASCDAGESAATHGIAVSGFASTPYNVAVGGTDFGDAYAGNTNSYWNRTNNASYGSAKSYIPEIPWNDSCASGLITAASGYAVSYGPGGFCNSMVARSYYLTTAGGSGGPSGCATGSPSISGVISGSCKGAAKPSWQSILGNPADGVRDIPDVSLFAADGVWGHYYVFCDTDRNDGGAPCTGAPSGWAGGGGTSFASPIMAGIQALVNQKQRAAQGNPNPVYYAIAAAEYGNSGSSLCNSSKGSAAGASCVFYDVTAGDNDVNCIGTRNCYVPGGRNGILSVSDSSSSGKAYGTGVGWDFATGIGTINASNLVSSWSLGVASMRSRATSLK